MEAEPLPEEFSGSRLRRSLLIVGAIVVVVAALIVLVPGLSSLRDRFNGAVPGWLVFAAVLQLGSCVSYVLVFRGVFCRHMSWRTSSVAANACDEAGRGLTMSSPSSNSRRSPSSGNASRSA